MLVTIASAALNGVEAYRVDVEVDVADGGLPQYLLVGLAATSIKEGASRIRSALRNCGRDIPSARVTVNLAPADRRKEGAAFDLPVATGILAAETEALSPRLQGLLMLGELGLDGSVRQVPGVLSAAILARAEGLRGVLVPAACAAEAAEVDGIEVYEVEHFGQIVRAITEDRPLVRTSVRRRVTRPVFERDFSEVRGQALARRAVEIAVAGGHNLLLYGPPGVGKTMLAQRIPSVLPRMTHEESIEVTQIYSAVGMAPGNGLMTARPFRAPHHTISTAALAGGGSVPRPGELSLAHRGVLFLDELPEYARAALETLRQPLEERRITIARVHGTAVLPASLLLVASANPCPCGWHGSGRRACTCSPTAVTRYRSRLSGPLLDRIDLQVRVGPVDLTELRGQDGETSAAIRERVTRARDIQHARGGMLNAELRGKRMRRLCELSPRGEAMLERLQKRRSAMSARGVDRVIRMARTIADLADIPVIGSEEIVEAAMFRALENDPVSAPRVFTIPNMRPRKPSHEPGAGKAAVTAIAPALAKKETA